MNPDPDEHTHPGEEDLEWGQGIKEKHRVEKPQTKYSAVGEQARKMISHENLCKVFCGGKSCKYCTSENWQKEQMAVNGLYSEWVTCNILATARMSSDNIKKFDMIQQLQNLQVKTVVNLQQPGEHAYCGSGNHKSGFSYNPQTLMDAGLFFYNFTIQDYGVTGMSTLLDIVKVMQFAVSLGKVAVHCHAGLGRTGLIIACYLIYNNRVKTIKAIQYVRSRRPGAIQTKQQIRACQQFEQYLEPFFIIFSKIHAVSFNQFLTRQRHLLHGYEARKLKHIPKVVYVCCERLLELCGNGNALSSLRNTPEHSDLDSLNCLLTSRGVSPCDQLNFEEAGVCLNQLLQSSSTGALEMLQRSPSSSQSGDQNVVEEGANMTLHEEGPRNSNSADVSHNNDDDDDDCIVYGQDRENLKKENKFTEELSWKAEDAQESSDKNSVCSIDRPTEMLSSEQIWDVIIKTDYPEHVLKRLDELMECLNKTERAWQDLAREENPLVVCGIMCAWLDELNEPILRAQDISCLVENVSNPEKALLHLEKSTKHFLEYIILVISKFELTSETFRHHVLEFFLSYLCQKRLNLSHDTSFRQRFSDDLKPEYAANLFKLFLHLLEH